MAHDATTYTSRARILAAIAVLAAACGGHRGVVQHAEHAGLTALPLVPRPRKVEPCRAGSVSASSSLVFDRGAPDDESYTLDVEGDHARIRANRLPGLLHAKTTLAALATAPPADRSPCLHIEDAPRASFRGMHLDVARHFFAKKVVERYLDVLALYKLNVFHWHLSDDQGFRLELKKHPELARVGGTDGFYTQADVREVVAYAAQRGITVIPEIEMPGHARAILAAHPELSCMREKLELPRTWGVFDDVLCAGDDGTFALVSDIVAEVAQLFPGPFIHIGGDEVPTTRWSSCPRCAARMRAEKIGVDQLEAYFVRRVAELVRAQGKRTMIWDEGLSDGLPKDVIVVAWQNRERAQKAALAGYDVVMAPYDTVYFNIKQSRTGGEPGHEGFRPWPPVRALDVGREPHVLGGEGTLWTEYVTTPDEIDTMLAPRIAALADALWSGPENGHGDFAARFVAHRARLDALRVKYFIEPPTLPGAKRAFVDELAIPIAPATLFSDGEIRFTLDGTEPTRTSAKYVRPLLLERTSDVSAATFLANGRRSATVRLHAEKQTPRPGAPSPAFEGVRYAYFEGEFHRLPDFAALGSPKQSGTLEGIALPESFRRDHFAVRYDTYVRADAPGVFRVTARADDGVRVAIDDVVIAEDDGEHEPRDATGEIALAPGFHAVRVWFFQGTGGRELSVRFEGPLLGGSVP